MPTYLARTQITHTRPVAGALDVARQRWSDESDGKLLLHLIEAGEQALRAEEEQRLEKRRIELDRISARYADAFVEGLDSIRQGWPE